MSNNSNSVLNRAKHRQNNDEFYTTYKTVEDELIHYTVHFKDKYVLCNCDDPLESNFSKYFIKNFNRLGLRKLVCTSYSTSSILATEGKLTDKEGDILEKGNGYVMSITRVPKMITPESTDKEVHDWLRKRKSIRKLKGTGDFRSPECVKYLKECDIVITNPPFSLFRDLIILIQEYKKKFLVIGNSNALMYKEIFPLIKNNEVWLGNHYGDMSFKVPEYSEKRKTRFWIDETGQKWRSLGNAMWLTNLDLERRHRDLVLTEYYDSEKYPRYDEFDAIEVSRVANIPKDYEGIMGVPITFLNKHNPDQFEIVGEANHGSDNEYDLFKPTIDGRQIYKRVLIRNKLIKKR